MRWGDKRYHSLNYELRKIFGRKVMKLCLDGGFTCPNRDGTIGTRGCIFCSEKGSGEFAGSSKLSIKEQIEQQKRLLFPKWGEGLYIAYFQSFTNTYAPVGTLEKKYLEALNCKGVVGLAIATRPDCLPCQVLDLLENINQSAYMWVELGLQTIHSSSARLLRRGYGISCFENAVSELRERGINVVVHLIMGIPGETREDILSSVRYIARSGVNGVKFHLLHILEGTDLYEMYKENPFPLLSKEEYISLVVDSLEILRPDIVIHRMTGDGQKEQLVGPKWSLDKLSVISGIDKELKRRDTYQGVKYF